MEFFVDNWLWFLVAGIIILMTLIGYIAEKTDFGRKEIQPKPKKEKVKKVKEKAKKVKGNDEPVEVLEIEKDDVKPELQVSLATDSILEKEPVESIIKPEETEEFPEELKVPFGDNSYEDSINNIPESDNHDNLVEEVVEEEPIEDQKLDDINTPDIELPDLNAVVAEVEDDDDDVWKF